MGRNLGEVLGGLAQQAAQAAVSRVTFRSQFTPEFSVDPFAPSAPPPEGGAGAGVDLDPVLALLRPEIEIMTAGGPIVVAPYGRPTENYLVPALLVAGLTGVGLVVAIGWIARKL